MKSPTDPTASEDACRRVKATTLEDAYDEWLIDRFGSLQCNDESRARLSMSSIDQMPPHPAAGRPSGPGPQGTQLFSADDLRQYARATQPSTPAKPSLHEPALEGVSAGVEGLRFTLRAGRQTIGRSANSDIIIDEPSVSSSHAWIIGRPRQYVIMNTLSTNGTFVNDKRIHEAMLKHNDHVRFGQAEFVFRTRDPGAAGSARLPWILAGSSTLIGLAVLAWWLI